MTIREFWSREAYRVALTTAGLYLLCLGGLFVYYQFFPSERHDHASFVPYGIITVWYLWVFLHNRILIRRFLFQKRFLAYISALLLGISIAAGLHMALLNLGTRSTTETFSDAVGALSYYTVLGSLIFLAYSYLRERKNFYQVSALKREVELQQMKNQLNPHFLFNALNNIYSYNLENNTIGNDLIMKLSQLMRYIVETSTKETISVQDEITFIENYLSFERERLGYRCDIRYSSTIKHPDRMIPPLVFFPFIENAVKHGANTIRKGKVEISITDADHTLGVSVKNEILNDTKSSTKTGLSNASRRLELLFPGRHKLDISSGETDFMVQLTLKLE